jgi:hypothetical protein
MLFWVELGKFTHCEGGWQDRLSFGLPIIVYLATVAYVTEANIIFYKYISGFRSSPLPEARDEVL